MLRWLALAGILVGGAAAASPRTEDTDKPDPQLAYVAIYLDINHAIGGSPEYARAKRIVLARVEKGGKLDRVGVLDVASRNPTLLKLQPGLYYLARLEFHSNQWQENYHPRLYLFEAKAGQFNFPGVWHFAGAWGSASEGGVYVRNWTTATSADLDRITTAFPLLAASQPVVLTRVVAPDNGEPKIAPQPTR